MPEIDVSRRRLIHAAGVGIAAVPLLGARGFAAQAGEPQAEGQPMPRGVDLPDGQTIEAREGSVGIAVIGLGGYALNNMMPRFADADGVHLAGVVSGNGQKAARVAKAYGLSPDQIYSYDTFDEIASDDRVGAVYIALPSGLHATWAEKAFAAGKHVLCEKPMALSSPECQRMIDAAEQANRRLMIAYRCHFEPHNLRAMELMQEGEIGPIRTIRTAHQYRTGRSTPEENWRLNRALAGGGPLEDYGIYGLQAALYLSGEMPEAISATTIQPEGDPRFREIFAHTASQLHFPSGAAAQLSTSYDAHGLNAVDVFGAEGALRMEPATSYSGHQMRLIKGGSRDRLSPGDGTVQFRRQLEHFADAVREGTAIRTGGDMGLRDVRLMEAIYAAAAKGESIKLNPDGTMRQG